MLRRTASLAAISLVTVVSNAAYAQGTGAAEESSPEQGAKDNVGLEEIVVTAQKQSENLQQVPISISAVTDTAISQFGVAGDDIRILSSRVANLNAESTFGRTYPRFYIRGLGNSDFALNAQSSVELYFDEVVLGNPILKGQPIFDIERIEVLRGPQGTLFGRNAVAGAVHVVTKKPTNNFEGRARASFGRFGTVNAEAAVGGPLIDDVLSARVAVLYQKQDDYVQNLVTGNKVGGFTDVAFRGQLQWTPSSDFSALLQVNTRTFDGVSALFHSTRNDPIFGTQALDPLKIMLGNDGIPDQTINTVSGSLHLNYEFGNIQLTSISSLSSVDYWNVGDVDATALDRLINIGTIDDFSQFTQEIRLSNGQSGRFRWQAGAYYFRESMKFANSTANNAFQIPNPPGPFDLGRPGDPGFGAVAFVDHTLTSWALFAHAEYDLTDRLSAIGGIRYNKDSTRASRIRGRFVPNPANIQYLPDFDTPFYANGDRGLISLFGAPLASQTEFKSNEVTWDLSLRYEVADDLNLYGRVAKGYQGGVIEAGGPFSSFNFARPQTVLSYELGLKSEPIPNRVRLNFAGFYYDFNDQQLQGFVDTGNGGFTARLLNANGGRGYGFEAELEARVTDNLLITGNVGYTKTEIEGPTFFSTLAGRVIDLDGRRFPFAPELTGAVSAEYTQPTNILGSADFYINTDWSYRSDVDARFTAIEDPQFRLDGYWEGGASMGFRNDRFNFGVWVRNITNKIAGTSVLSVAGFESRVFTNPRTYGINVGINF